MKVLDSTFLIDLLRAKKETLKIANSKEQLLTTQINMYEVMRGLLLNDTSRSRFAEIFELFDDIKVLPLDDDAVINSAAISAELMGKGQTIEDCDCMIAGTALSRGISTIVTKNVQHFKRIKGIKVEGY